MALKAIQKEAVASEVLGCKMTREYVLSQVADNLSYFNDCKFHFAVSECKQWINKIYDNFEEELKKAYIEGSDDAWKARNESIEKAIASVEDSYGWMTYEDKQNCIEILYELRGK